MEAPVFAFKSFARASRNFCSSVLKPCAADPEPPPSIPASAAAKGTTSDARIGKRLSESAPVVVEKLSTTYKRFIRASVVGLRRLMKWCEYRRYPGKCAPETKS